VNPTNQRTPKENHRLRSNTSTPVEKVTLKANIEIPVLRTRVPVVPFEHIYIARIDDGGT
jgi:hypothetical protein